MNEKKRHRIKFYSKEDLAGGHQLSKAEKLLDNFEQNTEFLLNDLIEFYNIKLYFDNLLFLRTWTEPQKTKFIEIVEQVYETLKEKIYTITDESLEKELYSLDYSFFDNFWKLLNDLNNCKNISKQIFAKTLQKNQRQIYHVLKQKKLVTKYDKTIRDFLIEYPKTAEIILSSIEEKDNFRKNEHKYFPQSLTLKDKESIINSYLDKEEPNLNYVRLIENSRDTSGFKLSPKTRLKAKKKSEELNEKILQVGYTRNAGIEVSFNKDQIEPVKSNYEGTVLKVSYSESFIDRFTNDISLFLVFKYLFLFTDERNLITFVSKQNELDVFETTLMKSKNEYEKGSTFHRKENLATIQLYIFEHYLKRKGKNIESLVNSYIDFINERISPHKIIFKLPNNESSFLEKIRVITPDFEFLLKQYKTLVDENCIDLELIQINSKPVGFSEIQSLKSKKYLYSNDNLIPQLQYLFFSDQSHLFYIKHFENKYQCLYDLITTENIKLEYFESYQKVKIESLIKDGYLELSNEGYVILFDDTRINLIGELYRKEVLSYWNYPVAYRNEMDVLIDKKLLIAENTLFSRLERNYLNFYLNKKEFTNGYDLRNKYLHGTNTFSENEHKNDYYRLIKLIILTLFKIDDDITIN